MPRRNYLIDARGKKRGNLPAIAEKMWEIKSEHWDWSLEKCAIEAGCKPSRAKVNAPKWWGHPALVERRKRFLDIAERRGMPTLLQMIDQAQNDREFARGEHNPAVAHDATKTIMKAAGHLEKEQSLMPPPVGIGQVSLNVIFANPDARRALESVVRVLEGLPSGDSGQVVTETVAQN